MTTWMRGRKYGGRKREQCETTLKGRESTIWWLIRNKVEKRVKDHIEISNLDKGTY